MNIKRVVGIGVLVGGLVGLAGWAGWVFTTPASHHVIAEAYQIGPPPAAVIDAATSTDVLAATVERWPGELPRYDDLILQEHLGRAFATAGDGWIWKIDLKTRQQERFARSPMSSAGARQIPGDDDRILFCGTRLDDNSYPATSQPGIYQLRISTREVTPMALRVPLSRPNPLPRTGNHGSIFVPEQETPQSLASMTESNSRQIAFCNDIDISADGKRVYMSEPFDYPQASSGTGAVAPAITLAKDGRLWMFDLERRTVSLVAQGYSFVDGVLLEGAPGAIEESVLITETPKFSITRLYLRGPKAGTDQPLLENLPGMPDGLDRDSAGRIWVGLLKMRSPFITWVHANPWIKPLLLRLPTRILPVKRSTAILALSPDASQVLLYAPHDGSKVSDIAVVVPGRDRLYLPSFGPENRGLVSLPYPAQTPPPAHLSKELAK